MERKVYESPEIIVNELELKDSIAESVSGSSLWEELM